MPIFVCGYAVFSQAWSHTVFTWLNVAATITHVVKLDVATIQGRLLFEGVFITLKHLACSYYSIIIISVELKSVQVNFTIVC